MNFMTTYYRNAICLVLKSLVFIASFVTGLWLLNSCEKPPTTIGSDILPVSDHIPVSSTDTFTIISSTNYDSRVRTDALKTPHIGVYSDPYFGTTTMGFVTQVRLEEEWPEGDWDIDSVKLVLRVMSNYGSNDNFKSLRISEISKMLYNNTAYYSDEPIDTTGFGVSAIIPTFRTDTVSLIEITLPNSFGEYLIREMDSLFYTIDTTEKDFRNYFKGFYFTIPAASAISPFLLGFDFTQDPLYPEYKNYFVLYMRDREDLYTYNYYFLLDSRKENARFTKIEHDFNANMNDIINGQFDSLSYVQGLYGAYTTISIPGLEAIKNDPNRIRSAVNKARLIVPAHFDGGNYTNTTVAQRLLMRYVNVEGEKEIVPDYFVDQYSEYFGGALDTAKCAYHFNLSNFVQNYFNDTQNKLKPELEIFLPANSVPNTILKANNSKTPIKFELTRTNF